MAAEDPRGGEESRWTSRVTLESANYVAKLNIRETPNNDTQPESPPPVEVVLAMFLLSPEWVFLGEHTGVSVQDRPEATWPPATRSAVKRLPTLRCRYVIQNRRENVENDTQNS